MEDQLTTLFTEDEKQEIIEAINKMPVFAEGEVATFGKFARWIERWFSFAQSINDGYRLEIYSYRADMHGRLNLTELIENVSDSTASKIERAIAPANDIYAEATAPLKKPVSDKWSYRYYDKRWWRKPKKLIGALKADYDKRGIE